MKKMIPRTLLLLACSLGGGIVFLFDQWTKMIFFQRTSPVTVIRRVLETTWHRNFGITFDLPLPAFAIAGITILILVLAGAFMVKNVYQQNIAPSFCLSLILAGALGNLADRLALGYVRDWILLFGRSAFNLADLAILIGIGWYLCLSARKTKSNPDESSGLLKEQKNG